MAAAAGFSVFVAVAWFVWLLLTSPSEPDGFGQDHQEQSAVASCWRGIRDGSISDTTQCSDYAQAHLDFFTEQLAPDAATTTCNLSRSHLAYARNSSPDATALLAQLEEEVQADCSHPDVTR
ncbi:hypothetical protein [Vulcanococcus limneticus]|uniref:hypothetical protein n=1 Tax=Vulcanococcus limneticus TaxID=2170428 RepID=UPI001E48B577|nr:hypothetical protein [Vulcanococcus limneticus]